MCGSPYHPPSFGAHLKVWDGFFLEFLGWRKNGNEKGLPRMHVEASHLSAFWRVLLLIKYFQIKTILCNNVTHLIWYFWWFFWNFLRLIRWPNGCWKLPHMRMCVVISTRMKRCKNSILLWEFYHYFRFSRIIKESPINMEFCGFFWFEKGCKNISSLVTRTDEGADRHIINKSPSAWRNSYLW